MKKYIIIFILLIFIALAGLLIVKQINKDNGLPNNNSENKTGENLPLEKPKATLPKEIYNLAGSVQEVAKDYLIFEASVTFLNEKNEKDIKNEIKKAIITAKTKLMRLTFVEIPGSQSRTPQETSILLKDIEKFDYVEVISNQDISQAQEFDATIIRLLQKNP